MKDSSSPPPGGRKRGLLPMHAAGALILAPSVLVMVWNLIGAAVVLLAIPLFFLLMIFLVVGVKKPPLWFPEDPGD